jgi:hypothetical protein
MKSSAGPAVRTTTLVEDPPHAGVWAALVYALCTFALAYPALAGKFLVNPRSDQFIGGFPVRDFAAASLKAGHGIPQWNPYLFGGLPYIAAMHGDIFYPTFILRALLPTDVALTWSFIIHLFLAGCFTYLFLRGWGVRFYGSLVGGLAYMLSGPIASYASPGHDGKLYVSALLPLVLWLLVKGIRDGRAWAWGGLAISIGLAVLSPHPQLLQYLLLTSGAFALYLAFAATPAGPPLPRPVAIRRLAYALGGVVLGGVIGAVQYLPVREYVPWSPRAGGRAYEFATSFSLPLEELINTVVPQFSGILDHYWGRNGIHLHSEYVGGAVFVLALAGVIGGSWSSFRKFWLGVFVVSLLWALGSSTPFYHLVFAIVPGTPYFRAPSTMMYVTMFALAVFAGLGVERVLQRQVGSRYAIGWLIAAVIVALLGTSGALTNVARVVANSFDQSGRADQLISINAPDLVFGALRSALFIALAAGLLWAWVKERLNVRTVAWSLAALIAIDLWTVERHYWMFSPPAAQLYASDPAIDAIRTAPQPGRVMAIDFIQTAADRDPFFFGDGFMVHGLRNARGYHGNELGRYQTLLQHYAGPVMLSPEMWRHENVQYLYTTLPDSMLGQLQQAFHLSTAFKKILGPVRNAAGSIVYLYRTPDENPAAWVAPAMVRGTDEQAAATVLDAGFSPTRAAIVDTSAHVETVDPSKLPPPTGTPVTIDRYDAGAISLKLGSSPPAGSALVVSENYFPGWSATVDGKAAPVVRADYNLIGVVLPSGARNVELHFADAAYKTGKTVTLLAVAVAIALLIAGVVVQRRPPQAAAA